jgi:hypothetical protein
MVPGEALEPPQSFWLLRTLSLLRLPVPPFRPVGILAHLDAFTARPKQLVVGVFAKPPTTKQVHARALPIDAAKVTLKALQSYKRVNIRQFR